MRLPNGYGSVYKLSAKRRKPFIVKKTLGYHIDKENDKNVRDDIIIGYAATKAEGLQMLADYNKNSYDLSAGKLTFEGLYNKWFQSHSPGITDSSINSYRAAYNACESLHKRIFTELKLTDLQYLIDTIDKNYPATKKIKTLLLLMYKYAMPYDYVSKDYARYLNIWQYKDRNPNKYDRKEFSKTETEKLWEHSEDKFRQTILMLIYTGVRVQEFLSLKKEEIHLEEQYFDVLESKTENGIRKVPIADKILDFFKWWYEDSDSEYLIYTDI